MYIPAHFAEQNSDALRALIAARPLATLVVVDDGDFIANHIPLLYVADPASHGVLQGHVARANPLWQMLDRARPALAIFHGPDGYVSPSLYPSKVRDGKVVPTWNYAVVHVHGALRAIDDQTWVRDLVTRLTLSQEVTRAQPWQVDDAPPPYLDRMLGAVVGIELVIERLEGGWRQRHGAPVEGAMWPDYSGAPWMRQTNGH